MATINWPEDLPQGLTLRSYQEALPDNLLRDSFDIGPAGTRPRSTAGVFRVSGNMVMTTTQWDEFVEFCRDVLIHRSQAFGFPQQGVCGESPMPEWLVRIVEPPTRSALGDDQWEVQLVLEVLP